jgi:large subunit ribosomal protein L18
MGAFKKRKIIGTSERPRLSVYKALKNVHAQIIDDSKGITLVQVSSKDKKVGAKIKYGGNVEASKVVGAEIAKRAIEAGIKKVVFDKGKSLYHGRVKALADAARSAGLQF